MKIVIQCAGKKHPGRQGSGLRRPSDNLPVKFVALPNLAPTSPTFAYVRPDDLHESGGTWRQVLLGYNQRLDANPCHLARAHELYAQSAYSALTRRFGVDKIFILSAGWGLIPARFFTPDYDITFSTAANVAPHARRTKSKSDYKDFQLMPDDGEEIIFLGGKDYLPFFCDLTRNLEGGKRVFFSSQSEPTLGPGFVAERFPTARRTNWHYECAQALIEGELK